MLKVEKETRSSPVGVFNRPKVGAIINRPKVGAVINRPIGGRGCGGRMEWSRRERIYPFRRTGCVKRNA